MHTWESNFSNFVIKYLGKTETEFQNTSLNFFGGIILFKLGTSIKSENKIHLGSAVPQQEASVWGFIKEKKLTQDLVLNLKICLKLLHNIETYRILNTKCSFLYICMYSGMEWFSTFFRFLKTRFCWSGIFLWVQFQKIGNFGQARAGHKRGKVLILKESQGA